MLYVIQAIIIAFYEAEQYIMNIGGLILFQFVPVFNICEIIIQNRWLNAFLIDIFILQLKIIIIIHTKMPINELLIVL